MPKKDPKRNALPSEDFDEEFHTSEEEAVVDPNLMGELWDDEPTSVPDDEPEPEPEEAEEEEEEEEEEAPDEEPEEEAEEPSEEEDDEKLYKVKDKEYDLDSLVKEGLLDDLITQASQQAHFQKLYEEQKQQNEAALMQQRAQLAQQQQFQQQAQGPMVSIDQVKAHMAPHVTRAVQEGFLEPDFVEMYPNAAASQMFIYNDYIRMKQVMMGMYNYFMQNAAKQQYESAKSNFTSACASLSNRHELYRGLTDDKEQDEFFKFLAERVNPAVDVIDEEFLARQYLGYKQESVLEAVRQDRSKKKQSKKKKRKLAKGEGSAPRRGSHKKGEKTLDEVVMDGLMEQFNE